ncbi:MAG: ABC transporter permease, partial [Muribaculaceae bacterium]|nr:ABC transporter permease [Muribaculaceae bacterium]
DIITRLKNLPEVENATIVNTVLGGDRFNSLPLATENNDSIINWFPLIYLYKNSDFFNAYDIQGAEGYPSVAELMSKSFGENDIIITESMNRELWDGQPGLKGKYLLHFRDASDSVDTLRCNVVGVVKDFHVNSFMRTTMNVIYPLDFEDADLQLPPNIVVRLKEGVDADQFAADKLEELCDMLRVGNIYVKSVDSQDSFISKTEAIRGVTSYYNLNIFVAVLFLVNLILGVVGCVWLQTGKRVKEVGVLRSYGAVRGNITGMLIGESVVMATVAVIIGCFAYLQYALRDGLSNGVINNNNYLQQQSWVTNFGEHFAIISAIVYALIIICVIVGTYFPARHVSRIEPVDALRDE